mmetsp:Transcript_33066/g.55431  ORF Transcript_33066/g.55431 Transcript_33066/m.55431 type:complete len:88 (+) Transcript_33066:2-265(+)
MKPRGQHIAKKNTTVDHKHNNKSSRASNQTHRKEAEQIYSTLSPTTLDQLQSLYREDMEFWEALLQYGSPRQPDEVTVYDIFKEKQG